MALAWLVNFFQVFFFLRCVLVVLLIYAAVDLVCLHLSVFFFLCVCVSGGILPVEAGSCLQSGSQQSPDL